LIIAGAILGTLLGSLLLFGGFFLYRRNKKKQEGYNNYYNNYGQEGRILRPPPENDYINYEPTIALGASVSPAPDQ